MILDASAVLVFLWREPGQERVRDALLAGSRMATIDFSEVATKMRPEGGDRAGGEVEAGTAGDDGAGG